MAMEFRHSVSLEAPLVRSDSRLEAYSDALFSILATVMVLPIMHTEIPEDSKLTAHFYDVLLQKIGVYAYTFLLICYLWTTHVWLFEIIVKVDEFTVLLNLAMMMIITFFPFSSTLLQQYADQEISIQIFCGTLALLCVVRMLLVWHVFRHPAMIKDVIKENNEQHKEKRKLLAESITVFVLAAAAFVLSIFWTRAALVFLVLIPFADVLRSRAVTLYRKCRPGPEADNLAHLETFVPWRKRLFNETVCKERIEFFSDGVFAIVATLIILDICEENIPDAAAIKEHQGSLFNALREEAYVFFAYAGTFLTVALQWYVHHSLLHYVKEVSKLMMIFNFLCLLAVGISPIAYKLTSTFDNYKGDNKSNEAIAIQVNSAVILMTGLFQSALWITALFDSEKRLVEAAHHKGKDHMYMTCKLAVLPFAGLLMFFLSLVPHFKATIFIGVEISAVAVYVLLGLMFTEMRKWSRPSPLGAVNPDDTALSESPAVM